MVCNNYLPPFQKQLRADDPLGGSNCTCYSGAMAGQFHTCGERRPIGETVRYYTGDRSGGTTLPQVDAALNRGWGINLDTRIGASRLTWAQFAAKINAGHGAILQGSYDVLYNTRFSGSRTFKGNHAIFVPPGWKAMDPLCDGRRAGIYKYHGEAYPQSLLRTFAGRLMLNPSTGRRLGAGYVWCSLTRDNRSRWRADVPKSTYTKYHVPDGIITIRRNYDTSGWEGYCTPPKYYPARSGLPFAGRSLVKITSGGRKGYYISSKYAREV